jgi:hypothetical protein
MSRTTDNQKGKTSTGFLWQRLTGFSGRMRTARHAGHERCVPEMSAREFYDIAVSRGDIIFGMSSARRVTRNDR